MPRLLLIDTQLLLVAIVAAVDPRHIERIGRTKAYSIEDAVLLEGIASDHDGILVTPHILTEASNLLAREVVDPLLTTIRLRLAALVPTWVETLDKSAEVVTDPLFVRFGLTDAAIARTAASDVTILTDDLPLFDALGRRGYRIINFTHVRTQSWRETLEWQ